jgi:hypothetical protein
MGRYTHSALVGAISRRDRTTRENRGRYRSVKVNRYARNHRCAHVKRSSPV